MTHDTKIIRTIHDTRPEHKLTLQFRDADDLEWTRKILSRNDAMRPMDKSILIEALLRAIIED